MNTAFRLLVLALAAAPLAVPLSAAELEGVALEPRVRVDGEELQLNGAAVRTRVIFKVYVAGLYLPARVLTAQEAIEAKGPKRIVLVMLRDATAQQFVDSIDAGLRANNSEGEIAAVKAQTEELMAMIRAVGEAKKGMRIVLDYVPREGTTLFVDGVAQGKPMAGRAFNQALLRIWLGEDPVQPDLKEALLGGPQ
ncbi:MAG TPA: chalcone isomerase family protein [Burkholderiales bacterium]